LCNVSIRTINRSKGIIDSINIESRVDSTFYFKNQNYISKITTFRETQEKPIGYFRKNFGLGITLSDIYSNEFSYKRTIFDNILNYKIEFTNPIFNITYSGHLFNYNKYTNIEVYPTFVMNLSMRKNYSSLPSDKSINLSILLPNFRFTNLNSDRFSLMSIESNFLYVLTIKYSEQKIKSQLVSINNMGNIGINDEITNSNRSLEILLDMEGWINKYKNLIFYMNKLSKKTGVDMAGFMLKSNKIIKYIPLPSVQLGYRLGTYPSWVMNIGFQYWGGFMIKRINMIIFPKINFLWGYGDWGEWKGIKLKKMELGIDLQFFI